MGAQTSGIPATFTTELSGSVTSIFGTATSIISKTGSRPAAASHGGLSPEAQVGIGVGVGLAFLLAIIFGWLFVRKFKVQVRSRQNEDDLSSIEGDLMNEKIEHAGLVKLVELDGTGMSDPVELDGCERYEQEDTSLSELPGSDPTTIETLKV